MMNEITKAKATFLFNAMQNTFDMLFGRWQDEKQYEDFKEYEAYFKKMFDQFIKEVKMENAVFLKASKRPFGITFDFEGWRFDFTATSREYRWKARPLHKP